MDTTLHDMIAVLVVGVLEMAGDHDRFLRVRIPGTSATATTAPEAGK
jgi:hypothetical protein